MIHRALICTIVLLLIAVQPSNAQVDDLISLFTTPNCSGICFMGIVPRQTTQQELENILNNMQIPYTRTTAGQAGIVVLYTFNPSSYSPYILNESESVRVLFGGDTLEDIGLNLIDVHIADVVSAFGDPTLIGNRGESTVYVYADQGLVFFVTDPPDIVTVARVLSVGQNGSISGFMSVAPCDNAVEICQPSSSVTPTPTPILNTVIISDDDPIPSPLVLSEETRAWYNYTLSLSAPLTGSDSVTVRLDYYPPTPSNYAHVQTRVVRDPEIAWTTAQTLVFDANHTEYEVRIRARDDSTNHTGAVGRLSHHITVSNVAGYPVNTVDASGMRLTGSPFNGGNDASGAADSRNVLVFTVEDND